MNPHRTGLLTRARDDLDRDAAADGVSRMWARALFLLPFVGAVVIAATAAHRPLFLALVREDGPIEWAQFAGFFLASLLLAYAAWRLFARGDVVAGVLVAIGALGIFGIAGEEISWGQRIFDFGTPEALAEANHQDELNVHNITSFPVQRIGNIAQLLLGGAGLVLPWLTRVSPPVVRARILRLLSPPLFMTAGFGLLFAYRAVRFLWDSMAMTVVKYGEWPEFCFALGLFVYALLLVRSLRGDRPTGTTAPARPTGRSTPPPDRAPGLRRTAGSGVRRVEGPGHARVDQLGRREGRVGQ